MTSFIMAEENARIITGEDKIFTANMLAKEMIAREGREKVANATVGALLDDQGKLMVLSSVADVLKGLTPEDYAEYAPIAGVPAFLGCVKDVVFGDYRPKAFVEAVATPGGTGAIHNIIQNYTRRGDTVLTSDWYWGPYSTITQELERKLETYPMFDGNFQFNYRGFEEKVTELLRRQDRLSIILNTPAHNPTGYSLSSGDWDHVLAVLRKAAADKAKKITLVVDIAYIDFSGEGSENRAFLPKLDDNLPDNFMVAIAFSMSKSFTMYGMRGGALLCLSRNEAITKEFKMVNAFSSRGTWSNCTRASMIALIRICGDPALRDKVEAERTGFRSLLIQRGRVFTEAARKAGLLTTPYVAGFFISIPCQRTDVVAQELHQDGIFAVPLAKGVRVSLASVSEGWCAVLPERISAAIKKVNGN